MRGAHLTVRVLGDGNGPWIAADLENGVFKSDKGGWQSQSVYTPSAKSGSNGGVGTFFEGAMTVGNPSESVDEQIQANIRAAGCGR